MSFDKQERRNFLKGIRDYRASPKVEALVVREFLTSLDCPRALTVWLLYENKEHTQLANLGFNPEDYDGLNPVRNAYAATKFLSKFKGLTLDYDLDRAALDKFSEFEDLCKRTNNRFKNLAADTLFKGPAVHIHNTCVRKISQILGDWDGDELFDTPDWGPGASTLIKRRDACSEVKFQAEAGITRDLHSLLPVNLLEKKYPLWADHLRTIGYPVFEVGNKVITVAKDARANRVIAIEPGINLFFQKAAGEMIRTRLLRFGVNTRNQGLNQIAAFHGSRTMATATLDLSSASDSICWRLVEAILPPRWFQLLDSIRSHYGTLDGKVVRWEKFSSMGNGFTFPLQTLIFYALSYACVEYVGADTSCIRVYGDDIIIPSEAVELFASMLSFYGFRLNGDKSFTNTRFRESCGSHYFDGVDVKPLYLKDRLSTIQSVYKLANAVRRFAHNRGFGLGCDAAFKHVFALLVSSVPKAFRFRIPESLGDGGFISNFDEATPSRPKFCIEGYIVRTVELKTVNRLVAWPGYLLARLWDIDSRLEMETLLSRLPPRLIALVRHPLLDPPSSKKARKNRIPSGNQRLVINKSLVSQWVNLGPWVKIDVGR